MTRRTAGWDPEALENKDKERRRMIEPGRLREVPADPDARALRREILTSARAYIARRKAEEATPTLTPAALMHELRIGRNLAASILEELEAAGELVQVALGTFAPTPAAQPVGRGYALPLSQKEASALLRLLDSASAILSRGADPGLNLNPGDLTTLREIRRRLKGGPL